MRKLTVSRALTVLGATTVVASLVVVAPAQAKTRHDFAPPPNPTIIASGLDNPRGLTFGPDGRLYVVEAGRGGSGPCFTGPEGPACFGSSGAVTALDEPGVQHRVLFGLPSYGDAGTGDHAIGPSSIAFQTNGRVYVTEGLGLDLPSREANIPELDAMGQLLRVRLNQGDWSTAADLAAFEAANNPTGDELNVNPNDVIADGASQVVADAGANDLLRVAPNGRVSVITTFPNTLVDAPPFLGLPPGTQLSMDAVPTSVTKGPDGAYYVGQLTGFPFPVGGASIFRVADTPGAKPDPIAQGLTNVIGVAFNGSTLYAVEIFQNGLLSGDDTGALVRIDPSNGKSDVVYEGMPTPAGLAIQDGVAYISVCGTCAGGGKVLSITLPEE